MSDRIFTVSDSLFIDISSTNAELNGNIRLLYGDIILKSDYLKVVSCDESTVSLFDTGRIHEIIADGNVEIKFDDKVAITDCVVYSVVKRELVLTGYNSSISYFDSIIHGERIIYHINEKKFIIESGMSTKITAVVLP